MTRRDLRQRGAALRTRLHGASEAASPVPGYADWMDEVAYGGIWSRPGLALKDRMICTLVALSVLQRLDALRGMVVAALEVEMPPRAILEVLMHVGLYAGFPRPRPPRPARGRCSRPAAWSSPTSRRATTAMKCSTRAAAS